MHFLTNFLVLVITSYLSLTNSLADKIITVLPKTQAETISGEIAKQTDFNINKNNLIGINKLNSEYKNSATIPDILIKNAAYQSATALNGLYKEERSTSSVAEALVNIYCTYKTDKYIRTNTGTGFFINANGIILTNAHVAQFLLLETVSKTGTTKCIVRGGNPARPLYEAKLLYISPSWIQKNANLITNTEPKGTGERDFALLYVTAGLDNKPMPGRFPFLNIDTSLLSTNMMGAPIKVAGYPAIGLTGDNTIDKLVPVIATTTLTDMFTFVSQYADVIAIGESPVGEFGASGGPILNDQGDVIGLITTKGSSDINNHSLRALTLSYIDRTIIEESTFNLKKTVSPKYALRAQLFTQTIVPFLSRILESELE